MSNRHKNVKTIEIKGARMHNLKNINLDIPRHQLTVVTGVSGSGKSSLVFDTLYAEGQRRYVESLSAYARQFLGRLDKPEVDYIRGLTPAIALEQKVNTRNPRSTVATTTELYDYLKLLFARCGHTISPISGKEVKAHQVKDVVADFEALSNDSHFYVLLQAPKKNIHQWMESNLRKGFSRCFVNGRFKKIEQWLEEGNTSASPVYLLIDRIIKSEEDEEQISRLADSVQSAFWEGKGEMTAYIEHGSEIEYRNYSNRFEADGMEFERPSVDFLSFNNPYGACKKCEGFGSVIGIDPDLVIPDKQLSLYEGCVAPWRGETLKAWMHEFIAAASASEEFPIHKPYAQLSAKQKTLLWKGSRTVSGIDDFFNYLEEKSYKIQYRVMLAKYRGKTTCDECHGTRLRRDAGYVKLIHQNEHHQPLRSAERFACLSDVLLMTIEEARVFFQKLKLSDHEMEIADRMLKEINSRLEFLHLVGVGYLSLNRLSNSLSGGESQRINLATSLGSSLVGSTYVLDEPSIGLHSKDTLRLMEVLKQLRDIGNTVIVVEHDEDVMRTSDHMIDIGPLAGKLGGELVFSGTLSEMLKKETLTASYLNGQKQVAIPDKRRKWTNRISLKGNRLHNLKNFDVDIPLNTLTVVSGVSGSGKTSLIKGILYPAVLKYLGSYTAIKTGDFDGMAGDLKHIQQVEMVDQNPIGKSSRSNPVTYLKAYDAIRDLYAAQALSKSRGFTSGHFSFNVDGGRCDHCQGEGVVTVEMQFMADIHLKCEVCHGRRFKEEILEVSYKGKSIFDVLEMTVDEAMDFFTDQNTIVNRLKPLQDVGLGYISLGQSSNTLSGGEAQRVKLAYFLSKGSGKDKVLFIFDEPTTGLHFHDINKLLTSFNALIQQGHSIVVIEHNMDVIKAADWIIDLGPGGGPEGGTLLFAGLPEDLVQNKNSHTATFLRDKLPIN